MNEAGLSFVLLCFLTAAAIVFRNLRKTQNTMETIEKMLDAAMNGTFAETFFDESRLSALETRFARYLSSAETSSQNVSHEKDRIKSLIADISHQTKTPIANLLLYSELLMEEDLPVFAKANAEVLYDQSEKLRFLIDSLVKLSRLENGIIALSPQDRALQPMLQSIAEQYFVKAAEESLERTPELLPVLKEVGVVDSGGAGYICIIEGMIKLLNGESLSKDFSLSYRSLVSIPS